MLKISTDECDDNYLLITLIILRYCQKLLEFDIEGNRSFNKKTIEYAQKINSLLPFEPVKSEFVSGPTISKQENNLSLYNWDDLNKYLKNIFNSRKFKMDFLKYYPERLYYKISKSIETRTYFPLQNAIPAFSVLKIIDDIETSNYKENDLNNWIDHFNLYNYDNEMDNNVSKLLLNYATSKIELKNYGNSKNAIEILDISDRYAIIKSPKLLKDKSGKGKIITSVKGALSFKLKCVNDGILKIHLKSLDIEDANNVKFPIFIDYQSLQVNEKDIIKESIVATNDNPFIFEKNVKNNEIIEIKVTWLPFNKDSNYVNKKQFNLLNRLNKKNFK